MGGGAKSPPRVDQRPTRTAPNGAHKYLVPIHQPQVNAPVRLPMAQACALCVARRHPRLRSAVSEIVASAAAPLLPGVPVIALSARRATQATEPVMAVPRANTAAVGPAKSVAPIATVPRANIAAMASAFLTVWLAA